MVQFVPKDSYFFTESNKTLLEKAREAVAKEEGGGGGGGAGGGIAGGGVGGSMRKGSGGMFQKPFWKSSTDLSEEKVKAVDGATWYTVWIHNRGEGSSVVYEILHLKGGRREERGTHGTVSFCIRGYQTELAGVRKLAYSSTDTINESDVESCMWGMGAGGGGQCLPKQKKTVIAGIHR